ncbi:MAG: UDP-4-amino-4,6-dideoxy-N-acetyl-beta-L-altrosamine transaminase [Methylococcales bacterium]|nr:UDP-4-amino-4,6-dideoxy-N-acetyl-beta-L-altrosamine transaminase [Methylococcales bacterium]
MIPYGRQNISEKDIQSVVDILRSDYLTQGPVLPRFEKAVSDYVKSNYAVAVTNGTSALHIACLALGLGQGDWLWTSPITFVASANCGLYCGAKIDFVDIDPYTFNMSISALEQKLQEAEKKGVLPKVIIPVHFAGQSCDMKAMACLAQRYGFFIIEDACHAIGGTYAEQPIGSCQYSDIAVFSFHPVKIITTGEGGMAVTNQLLLAEKMSSLRRHGITRDAKKMTHESEGDWYYQQVDLGFNYRMTELQAALGLSQLKRLPEFIERRTQLAKQYNDLLADSSIATQQQIVEATSAWHLFVIRLKLPDGVTQKAIFSKLRKQNIGVNVHYIPVHLQPYYHKMGFRQGDFPIAENYYKHAISLPLFFDLAEADMMHVVTCLKKICSN